MNDSFDLFSSQGQPSPGQPGGGSIGTVIIEADGGSRGNPGIAGSGTVIYASDHSTVLRTIAYVVGTATNNVAEYQGLLNGLRAAYEMGASDVAVNMDSKLVVEQMSGRWKIKHPDMRELALKCQAIARNFRSVSYTWVPRAKNKLADELANKAMDALAKGAPVGELEDSQPAQQQEKSAPKEEPRSATKTEPVSQTNSASAWNGSTEAPTRLILVRHGQTQMSVDKLYSGLSDPALTEVGERQARAAASHLARTETNVAAVVASPLARCQQTAAMIANLVGKDVTTVDGLTEMDFGQWEGLTFAAAHDRDPELHEQWLRDVKVSTPGGESIADADKRVKKALNALLKKYRGQTVVVVSHVTPIKAIVRHTLGGKPDMVHRLHLDLASTSVVEFYSDGPTSMSLFNDTSYLEGC